MDLRLLRRAWLLDNMCWLNKRYHRWLRAMEEEKRRDRERKELIARQDKDIDLDGE